MTAQAHHSVELVEDADGATLTVAPTVAFEAPQDATEPWFTVEGRGLPVNVSATDLDRFAQLLLQLVEHYSERGGRVSGARYEAETSRDGINVRVVVDLTQQAVDIYGPDVDELGETVGGETSRILRIVISRRQKAPF